MRTKRLAPVSGYLTRDVELTGPDGSRVTFHAGYPCADNSKSKDSRQAALVIDGRAVYTEREAFRPRA